MVSEKSDTTSARDGLLALMRLTTRGWRETMHDVMALGMVVVLAIVAIGLATAIASVGLGAIAIAGLLVSGMVGK